MTLRLQRDTEFWEFVINRELIRQRRLVGLPPSEWTTDPIFREYSFTNVKREHDRATVLLKREFYDPWRARLGRYDRCDVVHPCPEVLLNATIYRFHGTLTAARIHGWHASWNDDAKAMLIQRDEEAQAIGTKIFTSAYIIPAGGVSGGKATVVAEIVSGVWKRAQNILDTDRWEVACDRMKDVWCVGSFTAKEVLLDYILATGWRPSDWDTWTPVGPGGKLGAGYVLNDFLQRIKEDEALEVCRALYAQRAERWPKQIAVGPASIDPSAELAREWMRPTPELDLTDIQFQLCEVAKYAKAKTGVGRPKRLFRPTIDDVTAFVKR